MRTPGWMLLALSVAGCASYSTDDMLRVRPSAGSAYLYTPQADSITAATRRAFVARGYALEADTAIGDSRVLVGLGGHGDHTPARAIIAPLDSLREVRIFAPGVKPPGAAPRLFLALDRELAGQGWRPVAGQRARVRLSGESDYVTGVLAPSAGVAGRLRLTARNRQVDLTAGDARQLQMSRGRYGHATEGLGVGMLLGFVVGAVVTPGDGSSWGVNKRLSGAALVGIAGGLVGAVMGTAVRTEVWSEVQVPVSPP